MTTVVVIACLIVLVVYIPYIGMLKPVFRAERQAHMNGPLLRDIDKGNAVGATLAWIGARLGLQAHPALTGFNEFVAHSGRGHQGYLLGVISGKGWWYYFPLAFAVKSPTATVLALLLCGVARHPQPACATDGEGAVNQPRLVCPLHPDRHLRGSEHG